MLSSVLFNQLMDLRCTPTHTHRGTLPRSLYLPDTWCKTIPVLDNVKSTALHFPKQQLVFFKKNLGMPMCTVYILLIKFIYKAFKEPCSLHLKYFGREKDQYIMFLIYSKLGAIDAHLFMSQKYLICSFPKLYLECLSFKIQGQQSLCRNKNLSHQTHIYHH